MIFQPISVLLLKLIRQFKMWRYFFTLLCLALMCGCGFEPQERVQYEYDALPVWVDQGEACMAHADRITNLSPRHPPYPGHRKTIDYIVSEITKIGAKAHVDSWLQSTPDGDFTLYNVYCFIEGKDSSKYMILGSHFDTKPHIICPGANDGASSTAVLLELIRTYVDSPPDVNLHCCFFDGEECYFDYNDEDGLYGSTRYAQRLKSENKVASCYGMILMDMIGDRDLEITLSRSTPKVWIERCQKVAKKLGHPERVTMYGHAIHDDHLPFEDVGISAVDLIDFHFGPRNVFWHTAADTMDKLSAESMGFIGNMVIELVRETVKDCRAQ